MAKKNPFVSPILKWVGGKRQLIGEISQLLPRDLSKRLYCEPFVGGGAVLFHIQPKKAIISDLNAELINVYEVVRDHPDELIESLARHENTPEHFYQVRSLDRDPLFEHVSDIERASRIIYLNKTCYNGLFRVNRAGEFNSPFGYYKQPNIVNEAGVYALSRYFRENDIEILASDYESLLSRELPEKTFVYLDPPYHPISETSSFTGYVQGGWTAESQRRLKDVCDSLTERGIHFMQSNSSAEFIKDLYQDYIITSVQATRSVNSVGASRGAVEELIIRNYE